MTAQTFENPIKILTHEQIKRLEHGQVLYKFPIDLQEEGMPDQSSLFVGSVCILTDNTLTLGDDNQACITVGPYGKVSSIFPEPFSATWVVNFAPLVGGGTYTFDEVTDGSWFILPEIADIPKGSALFDDEVDNKEKV